MRLLTPYRYIEEECAKIIARTHALNGPKEVVLGLRVSRELAAIAEIMPSMAKEAH